MQRFHSHDCSEFYSSPIYAERKRQEDMKKPPVSELPNENQPKTDIKKSSSYLPKESKKYMAAELLAMLSAPIITPIYKYPKITSIVCIAIIILCVCAHYVHTQPMQRFKNFISNAHQITATFLKKDNNTVLIGLIISIVYFGISSEILYANKIHFIWNSRSELRNLWGFGDRNKCLREAEYWSNFLIKQKQFQYIIDAKDREFSELSAKLQNEGEFYIESKEDEPKKVTIFFKDCKNRIRFSVVDSNSPAESKCVKLLIACGYHQIH